jgi:hypothetical protein
MVMVVLLWGLLVEMAGGERGMLVCRNRIPPFGKGMVPVLFCRIFVTQFVLGRILNLKCVFICLSLDYLFA